MRGVGGTYRVGGRALASQARGSAPDAVGSPNDALEGGELPSSFPSSARIISGGRLILLRLLAALPVSCSVSIEAEACERWSIRVR